MIEHQTPPIAIGAEGPWFEPRWEHKWIVSKETIHQLKTQTHALLLHFTQCNT